MKTTIILQCLSICFLTTSAHGMLGRVGMATKHLLHLPKGAALLQLPGQHEHSGRLLSSSHLSYEKNNDEKAQREWCSFGVKSTTSGHQLCFSQLPKTDAGTWNKYQFEVVREQREIFKKQRNACVTYSEEHGVVKTFSQSLQEFVAFLERTFPADSPVYNARNEYGQTLAMVIAGCQLGEYGVQLIKRLYARGASLCAVDYSGNTIMHYALCPELVIFLYQEGVSLDTSNKQGSTPLHIRVDNDDSAVVQMLLLCGANPTKPNVAGKCPLGLVKSNRVWSMLVHSIRIYEQEESCIELSDDFDETGYESDGDVNDE